MKLISFSTLLLTVMISGCSGINNEGAGVVTGGLVGGVIGNQFGGGSGKVIATTVGAVLGSVLGGSVGRTMDKVDRMEVKNALETVPTGQTRSWKNPDSGNRYSVQPTRTYYHESQPCREYVTKVIIDGKVEQVYGKACRQADGSWKVGN